MRKYFFCLLIALTAFRGFVGDVMAVEMVSTKMPAQQQSAKSSSVAPQAMPCHGARGAEAVDVVTLADDAKDSFVACQVCHLNVVVPSPEASSTQLIAAVSPQLASMIWHSATLAQTTKPPIS